MVGKHYNCSFSFFPLSLKGKLDRNMGLSRERGHERGHKQLGFFFFVHRRGKHFVQCREVLAYA